MACQGSKRDLCEQLTLKWGRGVGSNALSIVQRCKSCICGRKAQCRCLATLRKVYVLAPTQHMFECNRETSSRKLSFLSGPVEDQGQPLL